MEISDSLFGIAEDVDKLKKLGFERSAEIEVDNGGLKVEQIEHGQDSGGVYVFVFDGDVVYIGENEVELSRALRAYRYPVPTESEDKRIKRVLQSKLGSGDGSPQCTCWYLPQM